VNLQTRRHLIEQVEILLSEFSSGEKKEILVELHQGVPVSAFSSRLSGLEVFVKYLKENKRKSVKEIASLIMRKKSTVYNTYRAAKSKQQWSLDVSDDSILIPVELISDRTFSVQQHLVLFLSSQGLSLVEIAATLHRSVSTVKTAWRNSQNRGRKTNDR
jgi:hypothetical protein